MQERIIQKTSYFSPFLWLQAPEPPLELLCEGQTLACQQKLVLAQAAATSLAGISLLQLLLCDLAASQGGGAGAWLVQKVLLGPSEAARLSALFPLPLDLNSVVMHCTSPDFPLSLLGFRGQPLKDNLLWWLS